MKLPAMQLSHCSVLAAIGTDQGPWHTWHMRRWCSAGFHKQYDVIAEQTVCKLATWQLGTCYRTKPVIGAFILDGQYDISKNTQACKTQRFFLFLQPSWMFFLYWECWALIWCLWYVLCGNLQVAKMSFLTSVKAVLKPIKSFCNCTSTVADPSGY